MASLLDLTSQGDVGTITDDSQLSKVTLMGPQQLYELWERQPWSAHAIDLFAGTGALGLEALSRGAAYATFIEKHVPTARVIEENIVALGVTQQSTLLTTSAFLWAKRDLNHAERAGASATTSA